MTLDTIAPLRDDPSSACLPWRLTNPAHVAR
jgi:hypothetical protein